MEIRQIKHDNYLSLIPVGDLDANSSIEMDECMASSIKNGDIKLHIDGSELVYISSAGLGVFISHLDEVEEKGGKLVFSQLSPSVLDVFELLGLDQLVTIIKEDKDVSSLFS